MKVKIFNWFKENINLNKTSLIADATLLGFLILGPVFGSCDKVSLHKKDVSHQEDYIVRTLRENPKLKVIDLDKLIYNHINFSSEKQRLDFLTFMDSWKHSVSSYPLVETRKVGDMVYYSLYNWVNESTYVKKVGEISYNEKTQEGLFSYYLDDILSGYGRADFVFANLSEEMSIFKKIYIDSTYLSRKKLNLSYDYEYTLGNTAFFMIVLTKDESSYKIKFTRLISEYETVLDYKDYLELSKIFDKYMDNDVSLSPTGIFVECYDYFKKYLDKACASKMLEDRENCTRALNELYHRDKLHIDERFLNGIYLNDNECEVLEKNILEYNTDSTLMHDNYDYIISNMNMYKLKNQTLEKLMSRFYNGHKHQPDDFNDYMRSLMDYIGHRELVEVVVSDSDLLGAQYEYFDKVDIYHNDKIVSITNDGLDIVNISYNKHDDKYFDNLNHFFCNNWKSFIYKTYSNNDNSLVLKADYGCDDFGNLSSYIDMDDDNYSLDIRVSNITNSLEINSINIDLSLEDFKEWIQIFRVYTIDGFRNPIEILEHEKFLALIESISENNNLSADEKNNIFNSVEHFKNYMNLKKDKQITLN